MATGMRAVTCDVCLGDEGYPGFCWKCYGTGRIPLCEVPRKAIWSGKALLWYFAGVVIGLSGLYLLLHEIGVV